MLAYKQALELEPRNVGCSLQAQHYWQHTLGRFDEGDRPGPSGQSSSIHSGSQHIIVSALTTYYAGDWREAEAAFRKVLELNPQRPVHISAGPHLSCAVKTEEALTEMQKSPTQFGVVRGWRLLYHAVGKKRKRIAALAEYIEKNQNDGAFQIAEIYAYRGEIDKAFEWLERAYKQRDGGLSQMKGDPLLRNLGVIRAGQPS